MRPESGVGQRDGTERRILAGLRRAAYNLPGSPKPIRDGRANLQSGQTIKGGSSIFRIALVLLITVSVLGLVLTAAGCNKEADQPAKAQKTTTDGQPPAKKNGPITEPEPKTKPSGKHEFTMTAAQLAKEYAADKAAFDKKYVDKLVELEGVVEDPNLGPVGGSRPRVTLDGDKPPQFVDCRFK